LANKLQILYPHGGRKRERKEGEIKGERGRKKKREGRDNNNNIV
jgi:hypothetical protein